MSRMKRMKKLASLLLALVMALALAVPTLAAEEKGSITIDNAVKDKTYTIYRIFDLDSHDTGYKAMNYKVSPKWTAFFAEGATGRDYVDIDDQGYVTWKTGKNAADFAKAAIAYATAEDTKIDADATKTATGTELKFEDLELGYYLVSSSLGTLCSLDTTTPDVTIKEKNGAPTVDKEVQENSNDAWGKKNDANVGDTVNFKTTINVTDGDPKGYVLHDTMSEGLTFDKTSVVVKNGETTLTAGTDYTLVTEELDDNCTFEIRFTDDKLEPNDVVTVTYSAVVNDKAVIAGAGNPNTTDLEYTNNDKTEHTEKSETRTYVWEIEVLKYTNVKDGEDEQEKEQPLSGAQFVLYKEVNGTRYYAVVDANNKITSWTTDGVKPEEDAEESKTYASVFTTPESGKFTVTGLDSGTYYLEEIKAPAGYNMLKAPIKVVIDKAYSDADNEGTATVKYTYGETEATADPEIKVLNQTGAELPETGGMGTTLFYVLGGLLVVGAAVLLITKKRMSDRG